jgi:hypothetical protein
MISFARNFLEPFSYFIYALALFIEYRANKSGKSKVLLAYYIVATILITYACIVALDYNDDNNWLYNIHYFISALVFAYYFNGILIKSLEKNFIRVLYALVIVNLFFTGIMQTNNFFNSFGVAFFFLCVVVSAFIYFYQILHYLSEVNVLRSFDLWLVTGYLLYFLGSFLVVLTYKYFTDKFVEEQRFLLADIWAIQNLLLFICSIVVLIFQLWITYHRKLH